MSVKELKALLDTHGDSDYMEVVVFDCETGDYWEPVLYGRAGQVLII